MTCQAADSAVRLAEMKTPDPIPGVENSAHEGLAAVTVVIGRAVSFTVHKCRLCTKLSHNSLCSQAGESPRCCGCREWPIYDRPFFCQRSLTPFRVVHSALPPQVEARID